MNPRARTILLIGSVSFLVAIGWLDLNVAYRPVQASELAGAYAIERDRFVPAEELPDELILGESDRLSVRADGSGTRNIGSWKFDAVENVINVNDSTWDRRIRAIKGWTGTVLSVRISTEQGRAEEMIYHKTSAGTK